MPASAARVIEPVSGEIAEEFFASGVEFKPDGVAAVFVARGVSGFEAPGEGAGLGHGGFRGDQDRHVMFAVPFVGFGVVAGAIEFGDFIDFHPTDGVAGLRGAGLFRRDAGGRPWRARSAVRCRGGGGQDVEFENAGTLEEMLEGDGIGDGHADGVIILELRLHLVHGGDACGVLLPQSVEIVELSLSGETRRVVGGIGLLEDRLIIHRSQVRRIDLGDQG